MTNLSKRMLRGRPMLLTTTASLAQIHAELAKVRPALATAQRGWASISDDPDMLGALMFQPPATSPDLHAASAGRHPELITARLYWFNALRSRTRGSAPANPQYVLDGTDILISAIQNNEYLLVVASHNDADINNKVIPELKRAIMGVDPNVAISTTASPVGFDDPDFFLWLVQRWFNRTGAGVGIDIDAFDHVMARDPLAYETAIAQGVQPDRPELLTLLAKSTSIFGPAKFSITETTLALGCELTLAANGDFEVGARAISYPAGQFSSIPEMRLAAVVDLLYTVLPNMKSAYEHDHGWRAGVDRDSFRARMKADAQSLVARI